MICPMTQRLCLEQECFKSKETIFGGEFEIIACNKISKNEIILLNKDTWAKITDIDNNVKTI